MKKIDDSNDYEILDVQPGADDVEIHTAYIRAKEALNPDSMAHYSIVSEEEKEELRDKIETAYHNLVDRKIRNKHTNRVPQDLEAAGNLSVISNQTKSILLQHYGKIVEQLSFFDSKARNILVTSAQPLEGRTTTALGLAFTAALLKPNKRILLVDLDLRNSNLHHLLGLQESPGLREMLCGLNKVKDCFHASQLSNLMVVPSGKQAVDMPDIFRDEAMTQLFKGVTERFDLVFYDSPPVTDHMDALCLSSIADAVLMVIRSKISRADEVIHACDDIRQAGGKVIGATLNAFHNPIPSFLEKHL